MQVLRIGQRVSDFPIVRHALVGLPMALGPAGGDEFCRRDPPPFGFGHPTVPDGMGLRADEDEVPEALQFAASTRVEELVVAPPFREPAVQAIGLGEGGSVHAGKFARERSQLLFLRVESPQGVATLLPNH